MEHANEVVDRLVRDYHVGYIKMDYNIEPGIGTELNADSVGDGLLGHERAYLAWLDSVFARYPDLVIENCSSGGMRIDYAMLSRHSIQSTSDQEDYLRYASIAANAPSGLTPEQSAIWSYPMKGGGREEAVFNMCNALMRVFTRAVTWRKFPRRTSRLSRKRSIITRQSAATSSARCRSGRSVRRTLRTRGSRWALKPRTKRTSPCGDAARRTAAARCPVDFLRGNEHVNVRCAYPANHNTKCAWNPEKGTLTVDLPAPICARIFELEY